MHTFEATVVWERGREGRLSAPGNPPLPVATPPQFGGPTGLWAPEQLFVASVGSCLMSTFLYFAERFKVPFSSYSSTSRGTVEKTPQGLRFTGIDVAIAVTMPDDALTRASSLRMKEKLERYCPVSASLNCPVRLSLEMAPASAEGGQAPGAEERHATHERAVRATGDDEEQRRPS